MDKNGNENVSSINQQNDLIAKKNNLIAKKKNEALNNAINEAKVYIKKLFMESIPVIPCIDSPIDFEIELRYVYALTSVIMKILRYRFTTFYIMGMRGKNDRDVIFECIVKQVMEM